jgi:hypothetical protein
VGSADELPWAALLPIWNTYSIVENNLTKSLVVFGPKVSALKYGF